MAASPLKRSRVVRRRGLSGSAVPVRTVLYDFVHTVRGRGGPPGSVGERESTVHTARYGHAPEERRIFIPRGFRPVPNSRPPDSAEEKGKISDRTRTRTGWWERGKKGKKARHPADPSPPRCSCQIRQLKTTSRDCFHFHGARVAIVLLRQLSDGKNNPLFSYPNFGRSTQQLGLSGEQTEEDEEDAPHGIWQSVPCPLNPAP